MCQVLDVCEKKREKNEALVEAEKDRQGTLGFHYRTAHCYSFPISSTVPFLSIDSFSYLTANEKK